MSTIVFVTTERLSTDECKSMPVTFHLRRDGSEGYQRAMVVDQSKIDIGIQMIKRALKYLKVDYVLLQLMDSWFTSERMIECVLEHIKQSVNLIAKSKTKQYW